MLMRLCHGTRSLVGRSGETYINMPASTREQSRPFDIFHQYQHSSFAKHDYEMEEAEVLSSGARKRPLCPRARLPPVLTGTARLKDDRQQGSGNRTVPEIASCQNSNTCRSVFSFSNVYFQFAINPRDFRQRLASQTPCTFPFWEVIPFAKAYQSMFAFQVHPV